MKKKFFLFFLFMAFIALLVFSCSKRNDVNTIKESLHKNISFRNYVARDIARKIQFISYSLSALPSTQWGKFRNDISNISDPSTEIIGAIFSRYSLNFNQLSKVVFFEMAEQLKLLEKVPALRLLSETDLKTTIETNYRIVSSELLSNAKANYDNQLVKANKSNAPEQEIDKKTALFSNDAQGKMIITDVGEFEEYYGLIPTDMTEAEIEGVVDGALYDLLSNAAPGLTGAEIWGCFKSAIITAVGGIGVILSLDKLIEVYGISGAVKAVGKALIKSAGWLIAISAAADFGFCLWSESSY